MTTEIMAVVGDELPRNLEAEQAVLGSLLQDRDAIIEVNQLLQPEDFALRAHALIYRVMLSLYEQRSYVDFITVLEEIERRAWLEDVGGRGYLTELVDVVPTAVHVEQYARIVERTSILRRLIGTGQQIAGIAQRPGIDADQAISLSEDALLAVAQRRSSTGFMPIHDILASILERLDYVHENKGALIGVPTGFIDLDKLLGGLQPSDLIILGARPAHGKCLTADTLIDDPLTGERVSIERFVRERRPFVSGMSGDGSVETKVIGDWIDSGIKPCFLVRTRTGREVKVTGHHPFFAVNGWTPLHDLRVGSSIAVPARLPIFGTNTAMPDSLVRSLAHRIAVGLRSSPATNLTFTHTYPMPAGDCSASIEGRSAPSSTSAVARDGRDHGASEPHPYAAHAAVAVAPPDQDGRGLAPAGARGERPEEICFPASVWTWDRPTLALFMRALLDCAGSTQAGPDGARIEFAAASQTLARDVQHALLRFGIISCLRRQALRSWGVVITGDRDIESYQRELGRPGGRSPELQTVSNPDLYWDQIAHIEPIGDHQVYDLTVPDGSNFVANGVFVHNTALALGLCHNSAVRYKQKVAIFSLEMSKEQLVQRLLCMQGRLDNGRLRSGYIDEDEWTRLIEAAAVLSETKIFIDDSAGVSPSEMRNRARRLQAEQGLDLIVVDYLQLMQGRSTENRVQEISGISRALKVLARELNVPVLALSQVSRGVDSRTNHVPLLSDLRESGCLAGETPVYLPDLGASRQIASLVGRSHFRVLALDAETMRLEPAWVTHAFATGTRPVFRLTTGAGRSIRATGNHRFFTLDGWKRLDQLRPGQRVALTHPLEGQEGYAAAPGAGTSPPTGGTAMAVLDVVQLTQLAGSDVCWDVIEAIVPDGQAQVYDLTVERHHNFVAAGIVVHNSIEQDADVVMFLCREEMYDPETEKQHIADIYVAKHRNGPTGHFALYFDQQQTRFRDLETHGSPL